MRRILLAVLLAAWALCAAATTVAAAPSEPARARVIVAFKPGAAALRAHPLGADRAGALRAGLQRRADTLAASAGLPLRSGRELGDRIQVLHATGADSATLAARLARHPDIAWAVVDGRRRALAVPNDPLYGQGLRARGPDAGQWYLRPPDAQIRSAVDAQTAWGRGLGQPSVVVAVVDTGVLADHLDLAGQVLPGIDAIAADPDGSFVSANDGDGEDGDASDPGDWISVEEDASGPFEGCGAGASSWHGTQVASIVAARANNGLGMSGTAPGVRILPVRVLGKCGGYDSDIIAGMLWAAGLRTVAGIANANPARVLNISLGSSGGCSSPYLDALQRLKNAGVVVVAAAGNSVGQAVGTPANCPGVIAVAGLRHVGSKVGFSDLGAEIAISAPGGNCVNIDPGSPCLYPIVAAANSGAHGPQAGGSIWTDSYHITVGTSFAAPIVAGTAALMLSTQPTLTPDELRQRLQSSARPFPTSGADNGSDPTPVPVCHPPNGSEQLQCYCTTGLCGAGMLDAAAAVAAAAGMVARFEVTPAAPVAGAEMRLDGSASVAGDGRSVVGYQWLLVDGGGIATAFGGATNASVATLRPTATGTLQVRLSVTDDLGRRAATERRLEIAAAPPTPTPPPTPGPTPAPTGGGGATGGLWLLGLALAALALRRA